MPDVSLLVTCEHASNHVPSDWQSLFENAPAILDTHRAYDPGSGELAHHLAEALGAPCFSARVTRLLIDHNRSLHNSALWSEFSRHLPAMEKARLLEDYYHPFRETVGRWIHERQMEGRQVLHVSVHSFTPVLDGRVRELEIGLLYDSRRSEEVRIANAWKRRLVTCRPTQRVRLNRPYLGRSDCHQNRYRKLYGSDDYVGLELEINQSLVGDDQAWTLLQRAVTARLRDVLAEVSGGSEFVRARL